VLAFLTSQGVKKTFPKKIQLTFVTYALVSQFKPQRSTFIVVLGQHFQIADKKRGARLMAWASPRALGLDSCKSDLPKPSFAWG